MTVILGRKNNYKSYYNNSCTRGYKTGYIIMKECRTEPYKSICGLVLIPFLVKALLGCKSGLGTVCDRGLRKGSKWGLTESVR